MTTTPSPTPLPVLTEERVRDLRYVYAQMDRGIITDAQFFVALCDHWLRTRVDGWQPIETAPSDVEVLLGWWNTWPNLAWQVAAGLAGSTKGGWRHGHATHWRPLPLPPQEPA